MTSQKDPIEAAFERVLRNLGSPDSRRVYENTWARFLKWLKSQKLTVQVVRPRHIEDHLAFLQEQGCVRSTCSRDLSIIRSVYSILVRDEIVEVNPAREVKTKKVSSEPKTPSMDVGKAKKLFDFEANTWEQRRARVCLSLLLGLGWRRAEVARLCVEDFRDGTVTGIFKGGKKVTAGVPPWVQDEVQEWCIYAGIVNGPLLPRSPLHHFPISGDMVYNIVRKASRAAGLGNFSPHSLRRTKITIEGERGVSLKERQLAVGHASQVTTERYDKANDASRVAPGQVLADIADHGLKYRNSPESKALFTLHCTHITQCKSELEKDRCRTVYRELHNQLQITPIFVTALEIEQLYKHLVLELSATGMLASIYEHKRRAGAGVPQSVEQFRKRR